MKEPKIYTRLTRNAASLGSYASLWLAADHLMVVRSTGYNESYSRVQFVDIKGIFLTPSDRRMWWGVWWGVLALIPAIRAALVLSNGEVPYFSGTFFVLFFAALGWNHLLGRGCRAFIVTGVQTAPLPSLVRRKKARRVIARVEPMIAAAQAHLAETVQAAPAPVPASVSQSAPPPPPTLPVPPAPPSQLPPQTPRLSEPLVAPPPPPPPLSG